MKTFKELFWLTALAFLALLSSCISTGTMKPEPKQEWDGKIINLQKK